MQTFMYPLPLLVTMTVWGCDSYFISLWFSVLIPEHLTDHSKSALVFVLVPADRIKCFQFDTGTHKLYVLYKTRFGPLNQTRHVYNTWEFSLEWTQVNEHCRMLVYNGRSGVWSLFRLCWRIYRFYKCSVWKKRGDTWKMEVSTDGLSNTFR